MSVSGTIFWRETFNRVRPPRDEYTRRLLIARGYYGAFHSAAEFVRAARIPYAKVYGSHERIHKSLTGCTSSFPGETADTNFADISTLGRDLKWMKKRRHTADYKLGMNVTEADYRDFHGRMIDFKEVLNRLEQQHRLPLSGY